MVKIHHIVINKANTFTIYIFTLKCHKNVTDNLPKENQSFGKKNQAPDIIIKRGKFY